MIERFKGWQTGVRLAPTSLIPHSGLNTEPLSLFDPIRTRGCAVLGIMLGTTIGVVHALKGFLGVVLGLVGCR